MKADNILQTIGRTPHVRINRLFGAVQRIALVGVHPPVGAREVFVDGALHVHQRLRVGPQRGAALAAGQHAARLIGQEHGLRVVAELARGRARAGNGRNAPSPS